MSVAPRHVKSSEETMRFLVLGVVVATTAIGCVDDT
jgi:hypothetical protein